MTKKKSVEMTVVKEINIKRKEKTLSLPTEKTLQK